MGEDDRIFRISFFSSVTNVLPPMVRNVPRTSANLCFFVLMFQTYFRDPSEKCMLIINASTFDMTPFFLNRPEISFSTGVRQANKDIFSDVIHGDKWFLWHFPPCVLVQVEPSN